MNDIKFAWVCRNIKFDEIRREELTDNILLARLYPSYITSDNCEIIAKILPTDSKDKNGIEIWQGDIVKGMTYEGGKYIYKTGEINYDSNCGRWMLGFQTLGSFTQNKKIIGNIYENPELLKQ